jgi:predicted double-glycine peptidase
LWENDRLTVISILPGHYRPLLKTGDRLRVELAGFPYAYQHLTIADVGSEIVGARSPFFGPEVAVRSHFKSSVIVKAHLPTRASRRWTLTNTTMGCRTAEARIRSSFLAAFVLACTIFWENNNESDGRFNHTHGSVSVLGRLHQDLARQFFIQQLAATECGAACLAMVLAYHGKHVPLAEVSEVTGANRDGVDAMKLLQSARWYGLQARGVKIELDSLRFLEKGSILHWEFSHFVVFDRLRRDGVDIVDPAYGRRFVPIEKFTQSFTGVVLTLKPGADFQRAADNTHPVWNYVQYVVRHSGVLSRVIAMSLLVQMFSLAVPALTGILVNGIVPQRRSTVACAGSRTHRRSGISVSVHVHAIAPLLQLRTRLDTQMTLSFIEHLMSLPYSFSAPARGRPADARQQQHDDSGNVDLEHHLRTAGRSLANLSRDPLIASPRLRYWFWYWACCSCWFPALSPRYQDLMSQELRLNRRRSPTLCRSFGIETLKSGGAEDRAVQQWSDLFVDELNVSLKRGRLSATVDSLMDALRAGSPLLVLWFGGLQVMNGNLTLGSMLALNTIASGFLGPIST